MVLFTTKPKHVSCHESVFVNQSVFQCHSAELFSTFILSVVFFMLKLNTVFLIMTPKHNHVKCNIFATL